MPYLMNGSTWNVVMIRHEPLSPKDMLDHIEEAFVTVRKQVFDLWRRAELN